MRVRLSRWTGRRPAFAKGFGEAGLVTKTTKKDHQEPSSALLFERFVLLVPIERAAVWLCTVTAPCAAADDGLM
jgi:hypothetical protein